MTKYEALVRYINSKSIGCVIKRQDLIKLNQEIKRSDVTTTDNYRKLLTKFGILGPGKKPGEYVIKDHIPEKLTLHKLTTATQNVKILLKRNKPWFEELFSK
jgi:hypothetical protein